MIVSHVSDLVRASLHKEDDEGFNGGVMHLAPIFNKLLISVPEITHDGKEFFETRERGLAVFINETACAVRFYPHENASGKLENIYHPDVLPPLGFIRFPRFSMQIMLGIETFPWDDRGAEIVQKLRRKLSRETFNDCDAAEYNVGYVPQTNHQRIALLDTVLDGEELYQSYDPGPLFPQYLQAHEKYRYLQQAFHHAWISASESSMQSFWQACHKAKREGLLHSGWETTPYERARKAATAYQQKMRAHDKKTKAMPV